MQINVMLRKCLTESTKSKSHLFKKHTEITYLVKPNHLIIKPIFAAMVLRGTFPKPPESMNWHSYEEMHKVWAKVKGQLKNKDFILSLHRIDIRNIQQKHIDLVREIYKDDVWM